MPRKWIEWIDACICDAHAHSPFKNLCGIRSRRLNNDCDCRIIARRFSNNSRRFQHLQIAGSHSDTHASLCHIVLRDRHFDGISEWFDSQNFQRTKFDCRSLQSLQMRHHSKNAAMLCAHGSEHANAMLKSRIKERNFRILRRDEFSVEPYFHVFLF